MVAVFMVPIPKRDIAESLDGMQDKNALTNELKPPRAKASYAFHSSGLNSENGMRANFLTGFISHLPVVRDTGPLRRIEHRPQPGMKNNESQTPSGWPA